MRLSREASGPSKIMPLIKVAAVTTVISWVLVLAFLALWLPLWANHDSIAMLRGMLWQLHGHFVYPQYAIGVFGIIGCMFLTWRFLIGGLWLGLSGNNKVFALFGDSICPRSVGRNTCLVGGTAVLPASARRDSRQGRSSNPNFHVACCRRSHRQILDGGVFLAQDSRAVPSPIFAGLVGLYGLLDYVRGFAVECHRIASALGYLSA
jgi:hypothetical protein